MGVGRTRNLSVLAASIATPLVIGGAGGLVTARALPDWYAGLAKPEWNPPGWLFGPVWTLLYTTMGVAAWLVWRRGEGIEDSPDERARARGALRVYGLQLALNALWTPVFFGVQRLDAAFFVIVALLVSIAETMRRFRRVSPAAAILIAPYLAWVAFATVLNWRIWRLNRG